MAYSVSHVIGVDLINPVTVNANSAGTNVPTFGPLGTQVWGSDGKRYVLAKAGNSFASGAAAQIDSSFNATTYSTGTSYASPVVTGGLANGDYAWFGAAFIT